MDEHGNLRPFFGEDTIGSADPHRTLQKSGEKLDASHVEFTPGVQKDSLLPESYRIQVRSDQFLHWDLGTPQFEANAPFLFGSPSSQNSKGAGGAYRAPPQTETKSGEKLEAWQPGVTRGAEEEEEKATQRSATLFNNQCKGERVCGGGGFQHPHPPWFQSL